MNRMQQRIRALEEENRALRERAAQQHAAFTEYAALMEARLVHFISSELLNISLRDALSVVGRSDLAALAPEWAGLPCPDDAVDLEALQNGGLYVILRQEYISLREGIPIPPASKKLYKILPSARQPAGPFRIPTILHPQPHQASVMPFNPQLIPMLQNFNPNIWQQLMTGNTAPPNQYFGNLLPRAPDRPFGQ